MDTIPVIQMFSGRSKNLVMRASPICVALCFLLGCSEKPSVYNDNYEIPGEADMALRDLLGVRTMKGQFTIPQAKKSYETGLILIRSGEVLGVTAWNIGNGLHTIHFDDQKEYARTIHVEYLNWRNEDAWKAMFRVTPSFATRGFATNQEFWNGFSSEKIRARGQSNDFINEKLGDYQVLSAAYASESNQAIGPIKVMQSRWEYIALLVVRFHDDDITLDDSYRPNPTPEDLQQLLPEWIVGTRE